MASTTRSCAQARRLPMPDPIPRHLHRLRRCGRQDHPRSTPTRPRAQPQQPARSLRRLQRAQSPHRRQAAIAVLMIECAHCGSAFTYVPSRGPRRKYCSTVCSSRAAWSVRDKAKFYQDRKTSTLVCLACTIEFIGLPTAKYCSTKCSATAANTARSTRQRIAQRKLRRAARGTSGKGTVWTQGPCNRCGVEFISKTNAVTTAKYCSVQCRELDKDDRRRERIALTLTDGEPVIRWRIFKRDRYRCHICKRKTDASKAVPHPRAPTIDHLIPIALGGRHEPANVACACFQCNSAKSHHLAGDQLALIG